MLDVVVLVAVLKTSGGVFTQSVVAPNMAQCHDSQPYIEKDIRRKGIELNNKYYKVDEIESVCLKF